MEVKYIFSFNVIKTNYFKLLDSCLIDHLTIKHLNHNYFLFKTYATENRFPKSFRSYYPAINFLLHGQTIQAHKVE